MRFVVQRVSRASVTVNNEVIGRIGKGFMVLVGINADDTEEIADKTIERKIGARGLRSIMEKSMI